MSLAAQGAYRNLLDSAWEQGALLPNTPAVLWRYALARTAEEFAAVADEVMPMFVPTEDGKYLHNETLTAEWQEASEKMERLSRVRAEAGHKGGLAKSGNCLANSSKALANSSNVMSCSLDTTSKNKEKETVESVFSYYLGKTNRNPKTYTLTSTRRKQGEARLAERMKVNDSDLSASAADLRQAIDALVASDFHMGRDPKSQGKKYCEWDNVFRSEDQLQEWLNKPLSKANGKIPTRPVIANSAADAELRRQLGGGR
jgi:uncharacterized protein YdaU (DUF1376 family)